MHDSIFTLRHEVCLVKAQPSRMGQEEHHEEFIAYVPQLRCAARQSAQAEKGRAQG